METRMATVIVRMESGFLTKARLDDHDAYE